MARIIAADDNKFILLAYSKIIGVLGHDITICSDGVKGFEAFKKEPADLVLLDFDMPGMTGLEVCAAIRKLPDGIKVPIIIASSFDDEETIINCLNAGANDYLTKPIKEAHLLAKIKNYLRTSSLHKNDFDLAKNQATIAGRFKIERLLGYGAHSVVFLAEDLNAAGTKVAIKLLNENLDTTQVAPMFVEVAEKLHSIQSDNILKVIDHGQYSGRLYVVLEFAEGGDLATCLKVRELIEVEAADLGIDVVKGLRDLEARGMAHLDLKPENIMISGGRYKLGDFGMQAPRQTAGATMAVGTELWSTAAYMAPECFAGEKAGIQCDIYSLGVTLYKALTGDNHFESEKPAVSMYRQINFTPPSIREYNRHFLPELADLIAQMLDKDPAKRPSLEIIENALVDIREKAKLRKDICYQEPERAEKPQLESKPGEAVIGDQGTTDKAVALRVKSPTGHVDMLRKSGKRMRIRRETVMTSILVVSALAISTFLSWSLSLFVIGDKAESPGAIMLVICENCGKKSEDRVLDIDKHRCKSCGAQAGHAMKCHACGKEFPWRLKPIETSDKIKYLEELDKQMRCPFCSSDDTDDLPTSAEAAARPAK